MKARVIKSSKREFDCLTIEDSKKIQAKAFGNLLKKEESIVVGDIVELKLDESTSDYFIEEVCSRKNEIYRLLIRESKRKVTAANCDYLVILNSVSKPQFKRGITDRFLARAVQWGISVLVVFNKMDEYNPSDFDIKFEKERLKFLEDVECFEISAKDKSYRPQFLDNGLEELKKRLKGKTSLFVGQSGVGKSKTIESLSEGRHSLKTRQVGRKSGKGSHTTTWSEIVDCGDFFLIDSPGIRQFSMEDIPSNELIGLFPDLEPLALKCSFQDCKHDENSSGCRFYMLDEEGYTLDEVEIIHSRLDSYLRFFEEISVVPDWEKKKGGRFKRGRGSY